MLLFKRATIKKMQKENTKIFPCVHFDIRHVVNSCCLGLAYHGFILVSVAMSLIKKTGNATDTSPVLATTNTYVFRFVGKELEHPKDTHTNVETTNKLHLE